LRVVEKNYIYSKEIEIIFKTDDIDRKYNQNFKWYKIPITDIGFLKLTRL